MLAAVQSLNCARHFETLWTTACQTPLSSTIPCSFLKFMSIELLMYFIDNKIIVKRVNDTGSVTQPRKIKSESFHHTILVTTFLDYINTN